MRNHVLLALLSWDKENERLSGETEKKLLTRARRVVEGSREWDLLFAEEMERAYAALLSRGRVTAVGIRLHLVGLDISARLILV